MTREGLMRLAAVIDEMGESLKDSEFAKAGPTRHRNAATFGLGAQLEVQSQARNRLCRTLVLRGLGPGPNHRKQTLSLG
jgi:hypothetical protein